MAQTEVAEAVSLASAISDASGLGSGFPVHSARATRALHIHQLAALVLGLGELARVVALSVVHTFGMLNSITRVLLQMLRRALALTKQPKLPGVA